MATKLDGPKLALSLLLVAGLPATAFAQVGTPPPASEDETTEYTPPPPPQSFTAEGRAQIAAQEEQRRQLAEERDAARNAPAPAPVAEPEPRTKGIPSVQIPPDNIMNRPEHSLVRGDGTGGLREWWGPLDMHALKYSPVIGTAKTEKIIPVIFERHNRVEQRLIANLDLFREIEEKKDQFDGSAGLAQLSEVTQIIQPIVEGGSLSIDLYDAQAISAMQGKTNEEIVRRYKRKQTEALRQQADGGSNPLAGFVKFMLEDGMREPRFAHDMLASEILMNFDAVVEAAGMTGREELVGLGELASRVNDEKPKRPLVNQATPILMALSIDDHTNLLMAARELREDPNVQNMIEIDILNDGQEESTIIEGDPDSFVQPGGVKTKYAALDPSGTGKASSNLNFNADQQSFYERYLLQVWRVQDPEANGQHKEKIEERYHPLYEFYLEERAKELAGEPHKLPPKPSEQEDG